MAAQFLFWEYLFLIFGIGSLRCVHCPIPPRRPTQAQGNNTYLILSWLRGKKTRPCYSKSEVKINARICGGPMGFRFSWSSRKTHTSYTFISSLLIVTEILLSRFFLYPKRNFRIRCMSKVLDEWSPLLLPTSFSFQLRDCSAQRFYFFLKYSKCGTVKGSKSHLL